MSKRAWKPTVVKKFEGDRGKRPLPDNEPTPYPKAPACPDNLDDGARGFWGSIGPKLEKLGLLTEVDGDAFSILCSIRSRLDWVWGELKGLGSDDDSKKRRAFLMKEERLYSTLYRQYAGEFGLSPRGRVGLTVGGREVESDDL